MDNDQELDFDAYSRGWAEGSLNVYVEQVKAGAKPAASLSLHKCHVLRAIEILIGEGLHFIVVPADEKWMTLYLFRDPCLADIILGLMDVPPRESLRHWIAGHLFGYNARDIAEFMEDREGQNPEAYPSPAAGEG